MTYDILVFDRQLARDSADADALYEQVVAGRGPAHSSNIMSDFIGAIRGYYPVFDERRAQEFRNSLVPPFELVTSAGWAWLGIPRHRLSAELILVTRLASELGLLLYDPQTGELNLPIANDPPADDAFLT